MAASVFRSGFLSLKRLNQLLARLVVTNKAFTVHPCFNKSGKMDSSFATTEPKPLTNFDPYDTQDKVTFDCISDLYAGHELANKVLQVREELIGFRKRGFVVGMELTLFDQNRWMPFLLSGQDARVFEATELILSIPEINRLSPEFGDSLPERASVLTELFLSIGHGLKKRLGKFASNDGINYAGKSNRIQIVEGVFSREDSVLEFHFSAAEFPTVIDSLGKFWESVELSARVMYGDALPFDKYNHWCEIGTQTPGYFRFDLDGAINGQALKGYKSIVKNKMIDPSKPELSGFVPLYEVRIFDDLGETVGFACVSLFLKEDGGFVYLSGDDDVPHQAMMELVKRAKLEGFFGVEGSLTIG